MKSFPLAFLVILCVAFGFSSSVVAQCEPTVDCNANGSADSCDIAENISDDCDGNGIPDECQISTDPSLDCNQDSILDACESALEDILSSSTPADDFGSAAAMSGNWLAIGAPESEISGFDAGAVFMFRNIGSRWVADVILTAPDPDDGADFGMSLSLRGDQLIVGSPGRDGGQSQGDMGAAYLFRHDGTNWNFEQKIEASNASQNAEFGISVGISDDRAVIGAWAALSGTDFGAAYIFSFDGNTWTEDQVIQSNDPDAAKRFGGEVAIDGDFIAVGDARADLGFLDHVGAVHIYTSITPTNWIFTQKLTAQDPQENSEFGSSIALSEGHLLVGAPIADDADGSAYHFERTSFVYTQSGKLSEGMDNAQQGSDVAITNNCLVVGAWLADDHRGKLVVYEQNSSGGYNMSAFTPTSALSGDRFGQKVAATGRWCLGTALPSEYAVTDRLIGLPDCDENGVEDPCDLFQGTGQDCNLDGYVDSCQIESGEVSDCNMDGIPDQCQLDDGSKPDCNSNGVIDSCDIATSTSPDCNANGIPDDCEDDCNMNGVEDGCEIADGLAFDCNGNGVLDVCDIASGSADDCNVNAIPDSCDVVTGVADDCNTNLVLDVCEILLGIADDCNSNGDIDLCELENGTSEDCNENNIPDICDIAYGLSTDCNGNLTPDECELSSGDQPDCNENGVIDSCDIASNYSGDCDLNSNPDECDVAEGAIDCNENLVPDVCEVDTDLIPPTIVGLPDSIEISAIAGLCEAVVTWDPPTIEDDCGVESVVNSHNSGDTFPVGITTVSVVVTDVSGNVTGQSFDVTVIDDQVPTIDSGPANIQVENTPGECEAVVTWEEPTSDDNCEIATFEPSVSSGSSFSVGTTVVTYVAEDTSGNTASHSFEVVVNDVDLPTIQGLPGTVIVNTNPGLCTALVSWAAPTITDNCPGATFTSDHSPGDAFPLGITLITYTATDAQGNQSQSSFEMTVVDDELPEVTGIPASVILENDPGNCGAVYEWVAPTATDNCGTALITLSHQSGDFFEVGTTVVTIVVDDENGNVLNFAFNVEVNDTEPPTITRMPDDITVSAEAGICTSNVDWELPEGNDNCAPSTLVSSHQAGIDFPVGTTLVTYTATDIYGNITKETFNITVVDEEFPTISGLPADLTTSSMPGVCGATVAWGEPIIDDNCGIASVTTTNERGSLFEVGTTTVTYTIVDVNDNVTEASFTVTINDVENPVISEMPSDLLLDNDPGECGAVATWELPTASDNCSISSFESDHASGDQFPVGTTVVTYTAIDPTGLEISASFNITVEDVELPTISGLVASITVTNSAGTCDGIASWDVPTAADNCEIAELTSTHEPGWVFGVGETLVTYTATDVHGNQISASLTVIVLDEEAPTFVEIPSGINLSNDLGLCSAVVTWDTPITTDNCEMLSLETTHAPGSVFPVGTTNVTYTATDIYGNVAQQSFDVSVSDDELPEIADVPATIEIDAEAGLCSAVATWDPASPTDNCEVLDFESTHSSGDVFPVGTTTVVLTATDNHSNVSTSSFDVIVTDTQAPVIVSMPEDIQLSTEPGICSALATWIEPTGEDNCEVLSLISSHDPDTYFEVGTTEVTITLTDINGNVTEDVMLVTVTDDEDPVIVNLPDRVTVPTEPGICEGTTSWTDPDTSDNCGVAALEVSVDSGSMLPVGETVVVYTVIDIHGNSSSQSFIVTVEDQELPQIIDAPADIAVSNDLDQCGATINWTEPSASDNCGIQSFTSSSTSGDFFGIGTVEVVLTATDIYGNEQNASFLVTVTDDQDPQILGLPLDITVSNDPGLCGASVSWTEPTASDNCDDVSLDASHQPGVFFPVGSTDVFYTAVDIYGNVFSDKFKVIVIDDEAPALVGLPSDMTLTAEAGLCSATVSWEVVTSTDNCEVESLTSDHQSGETFPVGTTEVTYETTDIHGNSTSGGFFITITDDENPEFVDLPERVTVPNEPGICSAAVSWDAPQAADNCGISGITSSHGSGDQFPVGETVVTLTATDIHGNQSTAQFIVEVEDVEAPQILDIPVDIVVENDGGQCGAIVSWTPPTSEDNCAIDTFDSSHSSGDFFAVGTTEVTFIAVDIHGNKTSGGFSVVVADEESPVILDVPADSTVSNDSGLCGASVTWQSPTATDNCSIDTFDSSHSSGDFFAVGATEVTLVAVDIHGNETSGSFTVVVTDEEAPVILDVPSDITVSNDSGLCGASVTWKSPTATDNCSIDTFDSSHSSGDFFAVGVTEVTLVAVDIHGNETSDSFTVVVVDEEYPVILDVPSDITVSNDSGLCGASVTWQSPTTTDNCSILVFEETHTSGMFFPVGRTPVTFAATDPAGNRTLASFDITVVDEESPDLLDIPANITTSTDPGQCEAVVEWTSPTAQDNCDIVDVQASHVSGSSFAIGTTTVTVTASDQYGNMSSGAFVITVLDDESPEILGVPDDVITSNDPDQCSALVEWIDPSSEDNCPGESLLLSSSSGDVFDVGVTEVQITVTDASGNSVTDSFTITVIDDENPTIVSSGDITVEATPGTCNAELAIAAPSVADNCEVGSVLNDYNGTSDASDVYELGTTIITWTVTDIYGNETTTTQSITVTVDETDCNENGQPDVCDIASGISSDCNVNGIPDECETDCNGNGIPDECDISSGGSADTNSNGTPDECEQPFQRGDANTTGIVDVTDPIYILQYVIGTGPAPSCKDSADCNDDESLDISDAIYLLQHLFLATAPPPAPYGVCGLDPDGESIGCDAYPICP